MNDVPINTRAYTGNDISMRVFKKDITKKTEYIETKKCFGKKKKKCPLRHLLFLSVVTATCAHVNRRLWIHGEQTSQKRGPATSGCQAKQCYWKHRQNGENTTTSDEKVINRPSISLRVTFVSFPGEIFLTNDARILRKQQKQKWRQGTKKVKKLPC